MAIYSRAEELHSLTWLVWAMAAAASVQLAPSPVYVALVIAIAVVVVSAHGKGGQLASTFPVLVALGVIFALIRVALTVLTVHDVGSVLVTIPQATLPRLLGGFTVGGTVEAPVLWQAAADGLAVVGVVAAFGAFNAVVSHYELVQSAPRAFYEPGLVVIVALAFVPSTVAAVRSIREADRARTGGRVVRRGRLVRQLVPLLETGMERAVNLAESMDSRGFGHLGASPSDRHAAACGVVALLALAGSFVALVGSARGLAAGLALSGVVALVAAVVLASSGQGRARYRPRLLTFKDKGLMMAIVAAPVALFWLSSAGEDTLRWTADPLRLPSFNPLVALALGLLCLPVLFVRAPGFDEADGLARPPERAGK